MEGLEIRELPLYEDHRGWLGEILREDESGFRPAMSYLSMTKPDFVRGPHEHKEQTDYFCFIGKFRLYFWDNRSTSSSYGERRIIDTNNVPTIAVVPPGIVHAYKNIDRREAFVLNMPDRLYKGRGKKEPVDEIRHEDNVSSAFRIEE